MRSPALRPVAVMPRGRADVQAMTASVDAAKGKPAARGKLSAPAGH